MTLQDATDRQEGGQRTRQGQGSRAPLVSVITVVFNGEGSIGCTLNSIIGQTFRNYELIVIDGASTDATVDTLRALDSKIGYWISEPDDGIYDAMNKGLRLARGRWVYFLNSGDRFVSADVLAKIAPILEKATVPVVVGYVRVLSGGTVTGRFPLGVTNSRSARELFQTRFCHQALFTRNEGYEKVGGFDSRFRTFADFFAFFQIASKLGGFEQVPVEIADFDLSGVSSNYKKSVPLFRERESIFEQFGEGRSRVSYLLGLGRALAYKYKRMIANNSV